MRLKHLRLKSISIFNGNSSFFLLVHVICFIF